MTGPFAFELRYRYPHMRIEDKTIWERFIDKNPGFFDKVEYDVHVGSKPEFSTVVTEFTGGDVGNIYQKKIDVVGYKGDKIYIVELKPRADARSLGQVLGYKSLYLRDIDSTASCIPMVITDFIGLDMHDLAGELGVVIVSA